MFLEVEVDLAQEEKWAKLDIQVFWVYQGGQGWMGWKASEAMWGDLGSLGQRVLLVTLE